MINEQIPIEETPHKSERQSATWDLRNAVRNYSTLVATQILVAGFSFASVWLITRWLGTESYGEIVAVIAASQIAQIFVNWTCVGLARFGVEEFVEEHSIRKAFWARSILAVPCYLLISLTSLLWFPFVSRGLALPAEVFWLLIAHITVTVFWLHIQHALQAAKLPREQGILLALERILIFAALIGFGLAKNLTWTTALISYIAAPIFVALIGLTKIRSLIFGGFIFDREMFQKLLKFSLPLIPFALVGFLSTSYLDAFFITRYLNKSELGVYSVAFQINGILMQFASVAGSLLLPLFITLNAGGKQTRITEYLENAMPLLTLAGGIFGIIVATVSAFFVPRVFGEGLSQVGVILWILVAAASVSLPILIGYAPFSNAISATRISMIAAIASAIVNVLLNFLLIPKYGLIGSAWATVGAFVGSFVVFVVLSGSHVALRKAPTFLCILPPMLGAVYCSWLGGFTMSLVVSVVAVLVVTFINWRTLKNGLAALQHFRSFAMAN